jgi:integrase/recombinase XerD
MRRPIQIQVEREAWNSSIAFHISNELPELSKGRRRKIRNTLEIFAREVKKHPNDVTRSDLEVFFASLSARHLKPWTIRDYKIILKRYYRKRKGRKFVEWIRIPNNLSSSIGPEDLISEEEFKAMLSRAESLRDKAMLSVLRESAFRPHEFLSIKRRNVSFDKYGAIIHIERGKTGPRSVRIITSSPILANWLENHPLKDSGAPLWVNLSTSGRYAALQPTGLRRILKRIANDAQVKKRIWPYLFRHTRNTELSTMLTEAPFCGYAGWRIGSKMPSYYVHLSAKNVDDAVLKSYGLKKGEEDGEKDNESQLPRQCLRCGSMNSPTQEICIKCGLALTLEAALRADDRLKRIEAVQHAIVQYVSKPTSEPLSDIVKRMLAEAEKG